MTKFEAYEAAFRAINEPADVLQLLDLLASVCHETQSELDEAWSGTNPKVWRDVGQAVSRAVVSADKAIQKHLA